MCMILQCFVNSWHAAIQLLNPSTFLPHFCTCILQREQSTHTSRWIPIQGLPSTVPYSPTSSSKSAKSMIHLSVTWKVCRTRSLARGWTIFNSNQIWPNFWRSAQKQIDWVATKRIEFAEFGFLFNQRYTLLIALNPGADSGILVPYSDSPIHRSRFSKWWDDEHAQSARLPRPNFAPLW